MSEEYQQIPRMEEEEEGIDILALLKGLLKGWKTILIVFAVFTVLGLLAAITMKRTYTVSSVMVPQTSSRSNSSLSSLASLAGFSLNATPTPELSPLVYPQIVNSVPFRRELMHTPLHYAQADTAVSMITYYKDYAKPTTLSKIKKYTIGLPGVILKAVRGKKEPIVMPVDSTAAGEGVYIPRPIVLTEDEEKLMELISRSVSLDVDKKEGYLTLTVVGTEPIQTAELAVKAQAMLQDEVTRFRTMKAQDELDYIQARYDEVKKDAESAQYALARMTDRSQSMTTSQARIETERLQSRYNLANSIYLEMAKQLENAKMAVKKDTPTLSILQPITVPVKPSNSRAKTLVVWMFLGFVLGCGIVLIKDWLPKFKEKWNSAGEEEESKQPKTT